MSFRQFVSSLAPDAISPVDIMDKADQQIAENTANKLNEELKSDKADLKEAQDNLQYIINFPGDQFYDPDSNKMVDKETMINILQNKINALNNKINYKIQQAIGASNLKGGKDQFLEFLINKAYQNVINDPVGSIEEVYDLRDQAIDIAEDDLIDGVDNIEDDIKKHLDDDFIEPIKKLLEEVGIAGIAIIAIGGVLIYRNRNTIKSYIPNVDVVI